MKPFKALFFASILAFLVSGISASAAADNRLGHNTLDDWRSVPYSWVDISVIGTNSGLHGADQVSGPIHMPLDFPYNGQTFDTVYIASNGYAAFTQPHGGPPMCAVAPLFNSFTSTTVDSIKYNWDETQQSFVIAWLGSQWSGFAGAYTFEVILDADGTVTFQYLTVGTNPSIKIGYFACQAPYGSWFCNESQGPWCPTDQSAVQFFGGPHQQIMGVVRHLGGSNPTIDHVQVWVSGGTDTAFTDLGGNYFLPVTPGTHTVNFHHGEHCDSVRTNFDVPADTNRTLNVSLRAPVCEVSATSLTYVVIHGQCSPQTFTISNRRGACPLHFSITDTVNWFGCTPDTGTVLPGDSIRITATVIPELAPLYFHTTTRVNSNASSNPWMIQIDENVTRVSEQNGALPTQFALHSNYPNPFNPTTLLPFDVPQESRVDIVIYNVMGQEVARPVSGTYAAGRYQVNFNAGDMPSGLYLVKMTAGSFTAHTKMMLLK